MNWKKYVSKRLLITDRIAGIARDEVELLEISPSGLRGLFKNKHTEYWDDLDEHEVLEVLKRPKRARKEGK